MSSEPTRQPADPAEQLRASLLAIRQLKSELSKLRAAASEPIAVVGIGCRLPGGVDSPSAFWRLLCEEVDAVTEVPPSRWSLENLYDPDPDAPGKTYSRHGAFVNDIAGFDASFFGISPREASRMDPQQRLALEVCWEALEDASIDPSSLAGSATGVFLGISSSDYSMQLLRDRADIDAYVGSGNAHGTAAGRLSFVLGLQGPCLAVDTACSSSLVSIHLACQSLRGRECDLALAGGVSAILAPEFVINFAKAHMLAPDGRCKTFDAAADGYVRGEGCGFVALRRLSDAVREGDRVVAVIRGSAVNHDGKTSGLTVPNGPAQERVVREALVRAGLDANDIGYVEAHGTGTSLGDPIELHALARAFASRDAGSGPLRVGSVKTNIGHLEAAAGIAGFIKTVLCVAHGEIPRSLHYHSLNPQISIDPARVEVAAARIPWPPTGTSRAAGVSSFGFGGTNAHIVVAEPPVQPETPRVHAAASGKQLLVLSARSTEALAASARRMAAYCETLPPDATTLAEVCRTSQVGRAHFEQRLALVADDAGSIAGALAAFAAGRRDVANLVVSANDVRREARIAFYCTSGGIPSERSVRSLLRHAAFRASLARCDAAAVPLFGTSLLDLLSGAKAGMNPERVVPALRLAIAEALGQLWRAWGIAPCAVVGDRSERLASACVGGTIEVEDALRAMVGSAQTMDGDGAMETLRAAGADVVLCLGSERIATIATIATIPSLHDEDGDDWCMAHALGDLYVRGAPIDWRGVWKNVESGPARVSLPTYPFQHSRYWSSPPLVDARVDSAVVPPIAARPPVPGELSVVSASMGFVERERAIRQYVRAEVARVLQYVPPALPDPDVGFFELGLDSLMALELATTLKDALGVDVPETLAMDYPTINAMTSFLASTVGDRARGNEPVVRAPAAEQRHAPPSNTSDIARRLATALEIGRADSSTDVSPR